MSFRPRIPTRSTHLAHDDEDDYDEDEEYEETPTKRMKNDEDLDEDEHHEYHDNDVQQGEPVEAKEPVEEESEAPRTIKALLKNMKEGVPTRAQQQREDELKLAREARLKRSKTKRKKTSGKGDGPDTDEADHHAAVAALLTDLLPKTPAPEPVIKEPPTPEQTTEEAASSGFSALGAVAPKIIIVDGKMVIDQSSLQMQSAPMIDPSTQVGVRDQVQHITSASFQKRTQTEKWSAEEIDRFYMALRQCGTDFTMIEQFFPDRDRRQIRNRYKKEEKENPEKIEWAIKNRLALDTKAFQALIAAKRAKRGEPASTGKKTDTDVKSDTGGDQAATATRELANQIRANVTRNETDEELLADHGI